MFHDKSPDVDKKMDAIKQQATVRLMQYLMAVSCVAFPASFFRVYQAGLMDVPHFLLHVVMFSAMVLFFKKRHQLNYKYTIWAFIVCSMMVSFVEFTRYGLLGVGEMAGMFAVLLSLFYLNAKVTIAVALIVSLFFFYGQFTFVSLGAGIGTSADDYMAMSTSWWNVYANAVGFFIVIGIGTRYFHKAMLNLNKNLESTNQKIQEQKARIEFLANHDALTGLPSLRVASDRMDAAIDEARQQQHHCGLLFLDLDGFKHVNDTFGHDAGDHVLKTISERIHETIRAEDTVCRIGGDEFLVVVHYLETYQGLEGLCVRLNEVIREPVTYKGLELTVGSSIGASGYPCCAEDANGLRAKADALMYEVKKSGKNGFLIAPELEVRVAAADSVSDRGYA